MAERRTTSTPEHRRPETTPGERLRRVLLELRDRVAASDPGLGRLRGALSAVVCVGTALPLQSALGSLLGYQTQAAFAATLFGAVVAMLGSNALVGYDRRAKVRQAAFFPVAVGIGLVGATLTDGRQALQVVGFAVVLFGAVWVRRFGSQWFFYGFMAWMGFFFATFLNATWALVPELLTASVASTVWVLVLATTVFRPDPRRLLHSTVGAFFARGRSVARESADLLEVTAGSDARRRRALRTQGARLAGLGEIALLAEAYSADPHAVAEGWSAAALRRRLIETQQAVDRFAGAATQLVDVEPAIVDEARRALDHLARRQDLAAVVASERLDRLADEAEDADRPGWWAARHLAYGVREFLRFDAAVDDPPEVDPGEEEFEAATALVNGNLPGAPAVARDVAPRGVRWNPLRHASLTTRQATQVMLAGVLAIALGTALSPTRYYWAVIAAFVTFTGTGTRAETFLKGAARIGGTVAGLVAAIALAHVTAGHTPAVIAAILVSIFAAFYLAKVSYAAMTFFITVLLGQMYTVLGTFSDALLALRLGETAVGAVAGVAVALLFAPLSTRDTVRSARAELFEAMAVLLDGVEAYAGGARPDLDALSRALDDRGRRLALVARPLTRPLVVGHSSSRTRQRLALLVAAVSQCRALTVSLQRRGVVRPEATATAARSLAEAARELAATDPGRATPEAGDPLTRGDLALFADRDAAHDRDPVVRHLHHLVGTLAQLAETRPTGPPVASR